MRSRHAVVFAALLAAALTAALACTQPAAPSATKPAAPGTTPAAKPAGPAEPEGAVVFGVNSAGSQGFNPAEVISEVNAFWYWPAFDGLTWVDRQGQIQPGLAESWDTDDAQTWTFTLRDDVRFHNGNQVTAEDVAETFNFYRNPENQLRAITSFADVSNVSAEDERTVVIELRQPVPAFPKFISLALVTEGRELAEQGADYLQNAQGTGPFRSIGFSANDFMEYEAMGADWVTPRGVPTVENVTLRFLQEPATLIAALRSGEVDIATAIPPDTVPQVEADFQVVPTQGTAEFHFDLNTPEGPLADARVRRAVNYAVDKEALRDNLFGGFGELDGQMIGSAVLGYNPDIEPYPYDVERARELLAEAGYEDGFEATFSVVGPAPGFGGSNIVTAIQQQLGEVGIELELVTFETATWLQAHGGHYDNRTDFFYLTVNWGRTFEADAVWRFWSADRTLETGRRWVDDDFDEMYQRAKNAVDEEERGRLYQEAGQYLHDEAPVLFMWTVAAPAAISRDVDWAPGLFADGYTTELSLR